MVGCKSALDSNLMFEVDWGSYWGKNWYCTSSFSWCEQLRLCFQVLATKGSSWAEFRSNCFDSIFTLFQFSCLTKLIGCYHSIRKKGEAHLFVSLGHIYILIYLLGYFLVGILSYIIINLIFDHKSSQLLNNYFNLNVYDSIDMKLSRFWNMNWKRLIDPRCQWNCCQHRDYSRWMLAHCFKNRNRVSY